MSRCVSSSMLIGEPCKMDDIFLPHSLRPSSLAEELREDMEQDMEQFSAGGCGSNTNGTNTNISNTNNSSKNHSSSSSSSSSSPSSSSAPTTNNNNNNNVNDDDDSNNNEDLDNIPLLPGHHHHHRGDHHQHHHHHHHEGGTGTTRILVDALVKGPTATTRWYQASLTSVVLTLVVLLCLIVGHRYIRLLLVWLQRQDLAVGLLLFTGLFFLISFPLFWGYALLLLAAGYLYGCLSGVVVVVGCGGVALTAANAIMRTCCRRWFMERFYSAKVEAILQVLNKGNQGFKIVALTRLTPIPFGLQNALFSLSDMSQPGYLVSSIVGLSPMAALYCYMGSTLRSMEDVLVDQSNQVTGYCILGGQMLFTAALLCFVVRKARGELKKAMDQTSNGKSSAAAADNNGCVVISEA